MKTFKKLTALVLAIVMCVALCSCTMYEKITIKKDGTTNIKVKYTLSKSEIKDIEDAMNDDTYLDDFIKKSNKQGLTETIDGIKYYSYIEETSGASVDEMNTSLTTAGEYTTTDFWTYASQTESDYDDIIEKAEIDIHIKVEIAFPYKIVETNCEKIDDYTVAFDETFNGNYVYATTEKSTADWTKAEDKVVAFKKLAKKQYTPDKIKGVNIVYNSKKALRVSWSAPLTMFITGYKIERKAGNDVWKQIKNVGLLSVDYDENTGNPYIVDKKVKPGETYSYRVKAYYKDSEFDLAGKYSNAQTIKFTNINKTPSFKVTVKGKKATVKIKNFDKSATGYQIKYSSNKNFKKAKTININKATTTIKNLNRTKTYYVKVRKFVKGASNNVYSKYSKVLRIKNA